MKINRVCYVTREEIKRTLDSKHSAWNYDMLDRNAMQASDSVDNLTNCTFFPEDDIRYADWPNFQSAYPWRIWLDEDIVAVSPLIQLSSGGVVIPSNQYILRPDNGPPFRSIELLRNTSAGFGGGSTSQRDVQIQATFGWWYRFLTAGTLAAAMSDTTSTTITVSNGAVPGVGDMILVDTERMIVQDRAAIDTTVSFTGLGTASAQDNQVQVPSAAAFSIGETLLADDERLLLVDAIGNTLITKRAWDGSQLAAHTGGTLWALRSLTVTRGDLGTTAATHANGKAVSVLAIPPLVKELATAWAVAGVTQGPAAYSQPGQQRESVAGVGIGDLCARVSTSYGRQMRQRVV
jgi:hypothetical protein